MGGEILCKGPGESMSRIGKQPIRSPRECPSRTARTARSRSRGPRASSSIAAASRGRRRGRGDRAFSSSATSTAPSAKARAFHGMTRALLANMVAGVTKGFQKKLEIQGVGWNAPGAGQEGRVLNIGYCHTGRRSTIPEGIKVECPKPTTIIIRGAEQAGRRPDGGEPSAPSVRPSLTRARASATRASTSAARPARASGADR